MAVNLFDVFVVGSADPSAAGETRLAAALSSKHGVPLATVAKAIAAKNLRAGQALEQAQAQALVRQLQAIGAVTVIRPAAGRGQNQSGTSHVAKSASPQAFAKVSGVQPVATMPPGASSTRQPTPSPAGTAGMSGLLADSMSGAGQAAGFGGPGFGMPALGSASTADPFAPLAPSRSAPAAPADGRDPFQPRRIATPVISTAVKDRTPAPRQHPSVPSGSGLALDASPPPKLELQRGDRVGADEEVSAVRARPSTAGASLREMDAGGSSGVAMDDDPKNLNLVRCVQHGLYYDKTKASGCRKCLAGARDYINKIEQQATGFRIGDFRSKPAKRAFLGLVFALVFGFLPAAYYCFGPGATDARRLRVEQELLSRQTGTEENLRVFDDLDVQVKASHERASRNTAIVWFAVAGVAMLGWYKIT
jgi:hypothetical protein